MIGPAIDAFAQAMGMHGFAWSRCQGRAVFAFERRGTLYLEEGADELLVYLSRELDSRGSVKARLSQALRLCHYRYQWPFVVQVGVRRRAQLVFLARLPLREVSLPAIEQALELLTRLHDQAAEAG